MCRGQCLLQPTLGGKSRKRLRPAYRRLRHNVWRRMRSASAERCIDCCTHALRRRRLVFQNENEIHQIPHAAVWSLARRRVSVKLLRPVLLHRERGHYNGGNAGETEPVCLLHTMRIAREPICFCDDSGAMALRTSNDM